MQINLCITLGFHIMYNDRNKKHTIKHLHIAHIKAQHCIIHKWIKHAIRCMPILYKYILLVKISGVGKLIKKPMGKLNKGKIITG